MCAFADYLAVCQYSNRRSRLNVCSNSTLTCTGHLHLHLHQLLTYVKATSVVWTSVLVRCRYLHYFLPLCVTWTSCYQRSPRNYLGALSHCFYKSYVPHQFKNRQRQWAITNPCTIQCAPFESCCTRSRQTHHHYLTREALLVTACHYTLVTELAIFISLKLSGKSSRSFNQGYKGRQASGTILQAK